MRCQIGVWERGATRRGLLAEPLAPGVFAFGLVELLEHRFAGAVHSPALVEPCKRENLSAGCAALSGAYQIGGIIPQGVTLGWLAMVRRTCLCLFKHNSGASYAGLLFAKNPLRKNSMRGLPQRYSPKQ